MKLHASKIIAHKKLYIHSTWIVPANLDGMEVERSLETEQQSTLQPEPENPVTVNTAAPPHLDVQGNSLGSTHEQPNTQPEPDLESVSHDTPQLLSGIYTKVVQVVRCLGFECNDNAFNLHRSLVQCVPELCMRVPPGSDSPTIRSSPYKSWTKNYSALSFMMNGQLFAEYERVSHARHTIVLQEPVAKDR